MFGYLKRVGRARQPQPDATQQNPTTEQPDSVALDSDRTVTTENLSESENAHTPA